MTTKNTRVALVTGGNKGIGFAICRALAEEGVQVVLAARSREKAETAIREMGDVACAPVAVTLDVTDEASIQDAVKFVDARFGGLDILINNAGVALDKFQSALDLDIKVYRDTFETNVFGLFAVTQAMAPLVMRRKGQIINLSSNLGSLATMGGLTLAYRSSKSAVNAITRVFAGELIEHGVRVNAVCPGWTRTDLGGMQADRSPEEGADTVLWLARMTEDGPNGGLFKDRETLAF